MLEHHEFHALLCEQDVGKVVSLPRWLPESRLMSSVQTLRLQSLDSLASLEGISGCTALQTLTLFNLESLASLEGLSGCTALQTLKLVGLDSLASLEGISGCTALQTLTLKYLDSLTSMPDLSSLTGLKVGGLPENLQPWEDGGRKPFSL